MDFGYVCVVMFNIPVNNFCQLAVSNLIGTFFYQKKNILIPQSPCMAEFIAEIYIICAHDCDWLLPVCKSM